MMAKLVEPERVVEGVAEVFLVPGTLYCTDQPTLITTVLGSCVAVCLWDRAHRIGGMNHYVLPTSREDDRTPRYGDVAIERLLDATVRLGARRQDIVAKLFGGANVLPYGEGRDTVGDRNLRIALERLRHHGIAVAARRTSGESGLLVKFETDTGVAWVRPVTP
jgi:chemotaxis protein CheD